MHKHNSRGLDPRREWSRGLALLKKLLRAYKNDDALYDKDNGIRQEILRHVGFLDGYLTHYTGQKRYDWGPSNWLDASETFRGMREQKVQRVVFWTWERKLPHSRGIFVDRKKKLGVIYEPRALEPSQVDNMKRRYFNAAVTQLTNKIGYNFLLVCGNQQKTWDCEKRVIQFGMCCFQDGAAKFNQHVGSIVNNEKMCSEKNCPLRITDVFKQMICVHFRYVAPNVNTK